LAYQRYTIYCSTEKKNEYLKLLHRLERLLIRLENIMASEEDENKEKKIIQVLRRKRIHRL